MIAAALAMDLMKGSDGLWKASDRSLYRKSVRVTVLSVAWGIQWHWLISVPVLYMEMGDTQSSKLKMYYTWSSFYLFEHNCWQPESQPILIPWEFCPWIYLRWNSWPVSLNSCFSFRLTVNSIVRLHKYSWALLCAPSSPEDHVGSRLQFRILKMFLILWYHVFSQKLCVLACCTPSILYVQREGIVEINSMLLILKKDIDSPMKEQKIYS